MEKDSSPSWKDNGGSQSCDWWALRWVAGSQRDESVVPLGRWDPENRGSQHQTEPTSWEQQNDEGLVNDVTAVTTMPGRFEALLMFPGSEEASCILVKL